MALYLGKERMNLYLKDSRVVLNMPITVATTTQTKTITADNKAIVDKNGFYITVKEEED